MATKDDCLSFKDKQNVFVDTPDNQYSNLNLNQTYHCSVNDSACLKSFTNDIRKNQNNDCSRLNNLKAKNDSYSWKKSNKHYSSTTFLNQNHNPEENNEFKKAKSANNSTLSLHIAAYENSIEADGNEKESVQKMDKTIGFVKKWETLKHFVDGSTSIIQNPFEFPRQQENRDSRPESMQFSASQRLLNPNQMDANNQIQPPPCEGITQKHSMLQSNIISSDARQYVNDPHTANVHGSRVTVKVSMEFAHLQRPYLATYEQFSPEFVSKLLKLVADETPTSVKIVKRVRSAGIPENVSLASENKAVLPEVIHPASNFTASTSNEVFTQGTSDRVPFPPNYRTSNMNIRHSSQTIFGSNDLGSSNIKTRQIVNDSDVTPKLTDDRMSPPNIADTHPSLLDLSDLGETERAPRLLSPNPSRTDVYGNLLGPSKKPIPKFRTSLLGNRSATEALNLTHNYGEIQFAEKPKLTAQQQFAKISVEKICNPRPHVIPAKEVYGFTDSASEPEDEGNSILSKTILTSAPEFDYTDDEIEYKRLLAEKTQKESKAEPRK